MLFHLAERRMINMLTCKMSLKMVLTGNLDNKKVVNKITGLFVVSIYSKYVSKGG